MYNLFLEKSCQNFLPIDVKKKFIFSKLNKKRDYIFPFYIMSLFKTKKMDCYKVYKDIKNSLILQLFVHVPIS